MIVGSDEVYRVAVPGSADLFEIELRGGISTAIDSKFVAILEAAASGHHTSSGSSATNVRTDLANALDEIDLGATSKIFCLVATETYVRLRLKPDSAGSDAFPSFPRVGDVTFLASAGLEASSAGSHAIVVDADGVFAASDDVVTLEVARRGAVQMADAPSQDSIAGTGSTLVSLSQSNLVALKAAREIGAKVVNSRRAVSIIDGVNW